MNFYETKMGRAFFENQLPRLIQSIQALTAALEKPPQAAVLSVEASPDFLSELYYGNYEPGIFKQTPESSELTQAVNDAHRKLEAMLSLEGREKLMEYEDALTQRDTYELRQAYESGFRTAVQMILAGMSQPVDRSSGGCADHGW